MGAERGDGRGPAGGVRLAVLAAVLMGMALGMPARSGEPPVRGDFTQAQCLECHGERNRELVAQWQRSRHAVADPPAQCVTCHGTGHDGGMAPRARRNQSCTECHPTAAKSYHLSKHGLIATLEGERWEWSLPLREANIRAPTCPYCHQHDGGHDAGTALLPLFATGHPSAEPPPRSPAPEELATPPADAARQEARAAPCRDCHAPRLVETWFASGERMVELGRMKVREAAAVVAEITRRDPLRGETARALLEGMAGTHLANVRLGVGHQSPDDQWWHGHPALDGDLLRIKSLLGESLRFPAPSGP